MHVIKEEKNFPFFQEYAHKFVYTDFIQHGQVSGQESGDRREKRGEKREEREEERNEERGGGSQGGRGKGGQTKSFLLFLFLQNNITVSEVQIKYPNTFMLHQAR